MPRPRRKFDYWIQRADQAHMPLFRNGVQIGTTNTLHRPTLKSATKLARRLGPGSTIERVHLIQGKRYAVRRWEILP